MPHSFPIIMAKSPQRRSHRRKQSLNPDAAGIDLGATQHYVAVPEGRDAQSVRHFGTHTDDLLALADWLQRCCISTVAMEATGVYWIPIFQILEDRGMEVYLVNARHVKHVPGRKTDVEDCQWLQYLHSVGLLNASFRPPAVICAMRSLMRHRRSLVQSGNEHLLRMQKALDQMNVQVHHAVTDITGETGQRILDAIVSGQRDPRALATLRDYRCKKSEAQIAKALHGDWREEHLFTLNQSLQAWRFHRELIAQCEAQIQAQLTQIHSHSDDPAPPTPKTGANKPDPTQRELLFRKFGTDLTAVEGINLQTAMTLLSEVGNDLAKFPTAAHFTSWLGLCPDNRITGGRKLAAHTRNVNNRLATALRMAAQSFHRSQSYWGDWFRRLRAKLGTKAAITAAAHKLARVLYAMIKTRSPYNPAKLGNPDLAKARKQRFLIKQAEALGYRLTPINSEVS
jgi:transposase